MSTAKQQFLTPPGRLVQGHPMEKQDKNMQGQPLMTQSGQATQRYFCALAYPKVYPAGHPQQGQPNAEFGAFYALLVQQAQQSFPQLFNAQGQCTHPRFSWKLIDGDGIDDNGKNNATKEGFAGHWVVKFQSSFPPRCFYAGRYAPQEQIQDPNVIRRGYYGRVSGTIEGNANPQKPGLYVNLSMFELSAQGPEIVSGPDASAVFGGTPAAGLPVGAMPLPGGGAAPGMPQVPGAQPALPSFPGMAPAVPAMGAPAAVPPAMTPPVMPGMPQTAVPPNPAFAAGPGVPAMPAMPGMPAMPQPPAMPVAPPVGPQLTAAGQAAFPGGSYAAFIAGGWTDAALRQAGYV